MDESVREAFRRDGAVLMKGLLNEEELRLCREAFDWAVANPGPSASVMYDGTPQKSLVDNANPLAKPHLDEMVMKLPLGKMFAELWGSENVWYYAEEIFLKSGGVGARSAWHQDTSYLPWTGKHWGNAWISFMPVPKANALEVVRGSQDGPRYDGTTFANPDDPTERLHGEESGLQRLPDVEADIAKDPSSWDRISYDITPGDVFVLHPGSLHGGAGVDANCPDRHTLVLRFFGDDATFNELPKTNPVFARNGTLFPEEMNKLNQGDPFRSPVFRKVI